VLALHDDGIDLKATWREEWVVNPDGATPMAACWRRWSIWRPIGRWLKRTDAAADVDLRVDYHAAAMPAI